MLLACGIAVNAMGPRPPRNNHDGGCVAVPLDGGLLTVLGVAGIAFYVYRKNNRKKDI